MCAADCPHRSLQNPVCCTRLLLQNDHPRFKTITAHDSMELTLRNTMTMTCRLITGIPSPTLLSRRRYPNRPRRAPSATQPSFTPLLAASSPLPPLSRIRLPIPPHPPTPLDSALSNTRSRTRRTRSKHRPPPSTRRRTSRPPPSCTPTPWAMSPLTMSVTVRVMCGREPKATARPASWRSLARRRR